MLKDAREIQQDFPQQADRVLVDAPCSGLGVLRRKPDSRWRKTQQLLKELPELQLEILKAVQPMLSREEFWFIVLYYSQGGKSGCGGKIP